MHFPTFIEIKAKSVAELHSLAKEVSLYIKKLHIRNSLKELKTTHEIPLAKKTLARIHTFLHTNTR